MEEGACFAPLLGSPVESPAHSWCSVVDGLMFALKHTIFYEIFNGYTFLESVSEPQVKNLRIKNGKIKALAISSLKAGPCK